PSIGEAKARRVALDQEGVFDLEYTALKMLTEAEKREREKGVLLWLVGLTPGGLAMVQHSPPGAALGRERMFFNLEQAVARHQATSVQDVTSRARSGRSAASTPEPRRRTSARRRCFAMPSRRRQCERSPVRWVRSVSPGQSSKTGGDNAQIRMARTRRADRDAAEPAARSGRHGRSPPPGIAAGIMQSEFAALSPLVAAVPDAPAINPAKDRRHRPGIDRPHGGHVRAVDRDGTDGRRPAR